MKTTPDTERERERDSRRLSERIRLRDESEMTGDESERERLRDSSETTWAGFGHDCER